VDRNDSRAVSRERCPECAKLGQDTKGDNCIVYSDGHKHCFACDWHQSSDGDISWKTSYKPPLDNGAIPDIQSRGLTKATCERFGVKIMAALDEDGDPIYTKIPGATDADWEIKYQGTSKLMFPYYDAKDLTTLRTVHIRDWSKPKDQGYPFDTRNGGSVAEISFFGLNCLNTKSDTLVIVEGETDTMTIAQMFPKLAVLGFPGGAGVRWATRSADIFSSFKRIVILTDNDHAGDNFKLELSKKLPEEKIYIGKYPRGYKDANDVLVAYNKLSRAESKKELFDELENAIKYPAKLTPPLIVPPEQMRKSFYDRWLSKKPKPKGIRTGYPELDEVTHGLKPGFLYVLAGDTGVCKSSLIENIALNAARLSGVKSMFISTEMGNDQTFDRIVQADTGLPFDRDMFFDPTPHAETLKKSVDFLSELITFRDQGPKINTDKVMATIDEAVDNGIRLILVDPITGTTDTADDYGWAKLENFMKELKAKAIARDIPIVTISHISRNGTKSGSVPETQHLRGSNGIGQQADFILAIGRDRETPVIECVVKKLDRVTGKSGSWKLYLENERIVSKSDVPSVLEVRHDKPAVKADTPKETDQCETGRAVPEQVREEDSGVQPLPRVRDDDTPVYDIPRLPTRLDYRQVAGCLVEQGAEALARLITPTPEDILAGNYATLRIMYKDGSEPSPPRDKCQFTEAFSAVNQPGHIYMFHRGKRIAVIRGQEEALSCQALPPDSGHQTGTDGALPETDEGTE